MLQWSNVLYWSPEMTGIYLVPRHMMQATLIHIIKIKYIFKKKAAELGVVVYI